MKIKEVKAYVLESKLRPEEYFTWTQSQVTKRVATIVEIETEEGITGVGEAFGFSPMATKAMIENSLKPKLIGGKSHGYQPSLGHALYHNQDGGAKGRGFNGYKRCGYSPLGY